MESRSPALQADFYHLSHRLDQLYVYIYPLPPEVPSHPTPRPTPLGHHRVRAELPVLCSRFPLSILHRVVYIWSFLGIASGKEPACQGRRHKRHGLDPGSGSSPRGGNGNPLQYSCQENPMHRGVWLATVHRVAKSQTRPNWLSTHRVYMSMPISQCIPLSFPLCVYMFILYICVSIPALEIRFICTIFLGEGNGTPLQYSCLENPMDGGAWWAAVHGVAQSRTRLSDLAAAPPFF